VRFSAIEAVAAIAFLVTSAPPTPALAWNADGHRLVCAIAWEVVAPQIRAKIQAVLDIETRAQFADSCTWADGYRDTHPETEPWFHITVPTDAKAVDLDRDCPPTRGCIVRRIEHDIEMLKGSAAKSEKATALKFLGHLVADLHQPLNVSFAKDRGGEDIKGTFLGRKVNLHAIWDAGLIESEPRSWQEIADSYGEIFNNRQHPPRTASTLVTWANESLWIMRTPATSYVGNPGGFAFDETYVEQNRHIAIEQMVRAGLRLGDLLSEALQ
jgi:hypothetical protein